MTVLCTLPNHFKTQNNAIMIFCYIIVANEHIYPHLKVLSRLNILLLNSCFDTKIYTRYALYIRYAQYHDYSQWVECGAGRLPTFDLHHLDGIDGDGDTAGRTVPLRVDVVPLAVVDVVQREVALLLAIAIQRHVHLVVGVP